MARDNRHLENELTDYLDERGSILTVAGPTKTGKTVLVKRLTEDPVWLEGGRIDSIETFWREIGDALSIYTEVGTDQSSGESWTGEGGLSGGVPGLVQASAKGATSSSSASGLNVAVSRPVSRVATEALLNGRRALVVDDFHYINRQLQTEIIRALKPIVFEGAAVILLTTSHRVRDVVNAEREMGARSTTIEVTHWGDDDLINIAVEGFKILRVRDVGNRLARKLADASFGSPHLMQQFCRELCKAQDIRSRQSTELDLHPPLAWTTFFKDQTEQDASEWASKLLRGPEQRGQKRAIWRLKNGLVHDHYGLILEAIRSTGPKLNLTKDEVKTAIDDTVDGQGPAIDRTTRVLKQMSEIARKRVADAAPTELELEQMIEIGHTETGQPVLEYVEDGAVPVLYIADPFFAFHLAYAWEVTVAAAHTPDRA